MLAKLLAIIIVTLAIVAPGSYLLRVAWKRGGTPRTVAIATLAAALMLVGWLVFPFDSGSTTQERITRFVGAWGILFMIVGVVVICAAALGKFTVRDRSGKEK